MLRKKYSNLFYYYFFTADLIQHYFHLWLNEKERWKFLSVIQNIQQNASHSLWAQLNYHISESLSIHSAWTQYHKLQSERKWIWLSNLSTFLNNLFAQKKLTSFFTFLICAPIIIVIIKLFHLICDKTCL